VFEAVNGIERRAVAVQATYTALVAILPEQSTAFEQDLAKSLAGNECRTSVG
jgi:hypothetical protein